MAGVAHEMAETNMDIVGMTRRRSREAKISIQFLMRRLQLTSGLVMLTYLFLHLVNHALGIGSLELAGRGLVLALRLWRSTPGTIALYGAASVHFALALHTIYGRRHWALPPAEWIRLWAGLSLPLLLIRHAVTTRLASSLYGFEPNYERVIVVLLASGTQGLQLALLAPGWIHGCLGLWFRLRHHAWARRMRLALLTVFVLLPLLSAAGFIHMMRAVEGESHLLPPVDAALAVHQAALNGARRDLVTLYLVLVAGTLFLGQLRNALERRRLRRESVDARLPARSASCGQDVHE
ncbi:adenylate cyclase [Paraburkholderia silvatlantica]|nr:adenylate cyclase [Paraburkholderia silvatlantica]PXW38515.1 adenylate cyclase [Paraburkholderia silvatlantica]TDQ92967.1 adenylate cyclase [Paraburkholderia silvatlantica]